MGGHPRLVFFAEKTLVEWLFHVLRLERITARVLSNNPLPVENHHALGFRIVDRIPLQRRQTEDELVLEPMAGAGESPVNLYSVKLELRRTEFPSG